MNTSTSSSGSQPCGCAACQCETPVTCRPRYFPRQLITPDDLSLEADYFRDALRRMRRMLWGYGVVCGATVCRAPACNPTDKEKWEPWTVVLKPGYILGPCGDEIIIPCEYRWDLRQAGVATSSGDSCPDPCDPWCTEPGKAPKDHTYCIAIKYKQIMSRPVRVLPGGCSCDDSQCEYSRWCDGYELGLLHDYPECCEEAKRDPILELERRFSGGIPECPVCPTSPWVCLAKITVDPCGCITYLQNCECRRLAVSFHDIWGKCDRDECCDVEYEEKRTPNPGQKAPPTPGASPKKSKP